MAKVSSPDGVSLRLLAQSFAVLAWVLRLFWRDWPAEGGLPHLPWKHEKTGPGDSPLSLSLHAQEILLRRSTSRARTQIWSANIMVITGYQENSRYFRITLKAGCGKAVEPGRVCAVARAWPQLSVMMAQLGAGHSLQGSLWLVSPHLWRPVHFPRHHPAALVNCLRLPLQPRP
ncbi:hypothetical protein VTI74DRAFT_8873 [Chaetomium olivicolor]